MFLKALLISILLHWILLRWAGPCLPNPAKWSQRDPAFDQQVSSRLITVVELSPEASFLGDEALASSQLDSEPGRLKQSPFPDLKPESNGATQPIATNAPEESPPIGKGEAPEAEEEQTVAAQSVQPVTKRVEAVGKTGVEGEAADDRGEELPQSSDPGRSNRVPAIEPEEAPSTSVENSSATGQEGIPTIGQENGHLAGLEGDPTTDPKNPLPTGTEGDLPAGPVKVFHTDPVYPRLARRRGWEGTVHLAVLIGRQGEVLAAKITKSSGYDLLDQAAQEAVSQWRYDWPPGQMAAGETIITVRIRFELEE